MRYYFIYNTVSGLRSYRLDQPTITVGTLPSNHLVLAGKDVEPIHGVVEMHHDGQWRITDLGSETGIYVNGQKIDVESDLHPQDKVLLGDVELHFEQQVIGQDSPTSPHVAHGAILENASPHREKRRGITKQGPIEKKLFHVDEHKKGPGKTLEVVAYWGDRVLEIEHYQRPGASKRQYPSVSTIGQPPHADFFAAGPQKLKRFTIAKATGSGFTLKLAKGMRAKLRRAGKIKNTTEPGNYKLSVKDIADVEYGPIRYFFLYVTLPRLKLPKQSPRDPLLLTLFWMGMLFFVVSGVLLFTIDPPDDDGKMDDVWSVVTVAQETKPIEREKEKPNPKPKKVVKLPEPQKKLKPQVPKSKPKPVKDPKKVVAKQKPKKTITPPQKSSLTSVTPQPKPPTPKPSPKPTAKPSPSPPSSAARTPSPPDGKSPGPRVPGKAVGKAMGARGGGMPGAKGAQRKGKGNVSALGVEGVKNDKASGVNLSKLGMSAGKILNKAGAGAIATNFKSSGGGLGGGSGTRGAKSRGLGGSLTQGSALGLEGSSSQLNKFGAGGGGLLSGSGGAGGFSTRGPGGKGRAPVNVMVASAGAPGVSGGLSEGEVNQVIKAHENAIRHCYERLLQRSPRTAGQITAKFVISAQGRVISISKSTDTIGSDSLTSCIFSKIRTWQFPKPVGGQKVNVSKPWKFST